MIELFLQEHLGLAGSTSMYDNSLSEWAVDEALPMTAGSRPRL